MQLAQQQMIVMRDHVRAERNQSLAVEDRIVAAVQVGDKQPLLPALKLAVLPLDAKLLRAVGAEVDQAVRVGAEAAAAPQDHRAFDGDQDALPGCDQLQQ